MRCDFVLAVTLAKDQKDTELMASVSAMTSRYKTRKAVLLNLLHYLYEFKDPVLFAETLLKYDGAEQFAKQDNVGLYWEIHYNTGTGDTEPPVELLAVVTAELYRAGLRFRKISMNACFSAGMPGRGVDSGVDFKDSVVAKYCVTLAKELDKDTDALKALEGCMVAGYRAIVILYDPGDEYFQTMKNAQTRLKHLGLTPQNTFSEGNGSLYPTHPKGNGPVLQLRATMNQLDDKESKLVKQIAKFKHSKEAPLAKLLSQSDGEIYRAVQTYVLTKRVLRFQNGQWVQGSVTEYTDSTDIKDLITEVTRFNDYLSKIQINLKF
jgi:hypothetical protein